MDAVSKRATEAAGSGDIGLGDARGWEYSPEGILAAGQQPARCGDEGGPRWTLIDQHDIVDERGAALDEQRMDLLLRGEPHIAAGDERDDRLAAQHLGSIGFEKAGDRQRGRE